MNTDASLAGTIRTRPVNVASAPKHGFMMFIYISVTHTASIPQQIASCASHKLATTQTYRQHTTSDSDLSTRTISIGVLLMLIIRFFFIKIIQHFWIIISIARDSFSCRFINNLILSLKLQVLQLDVTNILYNSSLICPIFFLNASSWIGTK